MAPKLIYCGSDNSHRLSVLRSAGYTVENCGSASDLGSFLAPGAEILVILFSDEEKETLPEMIDTARACCSAPLAVFRHSSNIQDDIGYDLFKRLMTMMWAQALSGRTAKDDLSTPPAGPEGAAAPTV